MHCKARFVVALGLLATAPAVAQTLDGADIESLIGDKRVLLSTPYGLELPLRYSGNGDVTGDISGFTMASMFTPSETGRWWVDGDQLCQQFPTWYDGQTYCFAIEQTGERTISWRRNDGLEGTARIEG
ncbi:hypothetical protein [Aliihoeflea sp. 40Bstr573]|uniref:hypothetical protein n=1 Tax=Aliihoeflea sp. 40Bstr573 TaxID=2696467 RepID=UPI002095F970|nr:hypothetical protein [Aliihoeflea sp. 40Bstr573]MCO6385615.1 hypothetical protein [Aliihoeflea sp. 40Bstr573]